MYIGASTQFHRIQGGLLPVFLYDLWLLKYELPFLVLLCLFISSFIFPAKHLTTVAAMDISNCMETGHEMPILFWSHDYVHCMREQKCSTISSLMSICQEFVTGNISSKQKDRSCTEIDKNNRISQIEKTKMYSNLFPFQVCNWTTNAYMLISIAEEPFFLNSWYFHWFLLLAKNRNRCNVVKGVPKVHLSSRARHKNLEGFTSVSINLKR